MSTLRLPAIGLCVAVLALASPRGEAFARPPGDAEGAQADAYFRQGKTLVQQGRLEDAYRAYLAGYQLRQGYDLAGNLGNVELELGKPRDAAEHLAFCLKIFPATGTVKQIEFIQARLAEARRRVGALSIKVNEPGAEVFIDGRSIGRSPLADEVFVDPGARTVEARLGGHKPASKVIQIDKGASAKVELSLAPIPPPAPSKELVLVRAPEVPHPPVPIQKKSVVPVIVGASVAVVGAAVGIAGATASSSAAKRADTTQAALSSSPLGMSACLSPDNKVPCDALDRAYLSKATFRAVSIVGFTASGVAAATTVLYALMPGAKQRDASIEASVVVAPGGAALGIKGRF